MLTANPPLDTCSRRTACNTYLYYSVYATDVRLTAKTERPSPRCPTRRQTLSDVVREAIGGTRPAVNGKYTGFVARFPNGLMSSSSSGLRRDPRSRPATLHRFVSKALRGVLVDAYRWSPSSTRPIRITTSSIRSMGSAIL